MSFSKSSVYVSESLALFCVIVSVFLSSAVSGLGAVSVSVSDFVLSLSVDRVVVSSVDVLWVSSVDVLPSDLPDSLFWSDFVVVSASLVGCVSLSSVEDF